MTVTCDKLLQFVMDEGTDVIGLQVYDRPEDILPRSHIEDIARKLPYKGLERLAGNNLFLGLSLDGFIPPKVSEKSARFDGERFESVAELLEQPYVYVFRPKYDETPEDATWHTVVARIDIKDKVVGIHYFSGAIPFLRKKEET